MRNPFALAAAIVIDAIEAAIIAAAVSVATTYAHKSSADLPELAFGPVFGVAFLVLVLLTLAGRSYPRL